MRGECYERHPDCTLAPNCYSDTDHIVPQRIARQAGATALTKVFIHHPVNKQQICRYEHLLKTREGDAPLPTETEMLRQITEHPHQLSARAQRVVNQALGRIQAI